MPIRAPDTRSTWPLSADTKFAHSFEAPPQDRRGARGIKIGFSLYWGMIRAGRQLRQPRHVPVSGRPTSPSVTPSIRTATSNVLPAPGDSSSGRHRYPLVLSRPRHALSPPTGSPSEPRQQSPKKTSRCQISLTTGRTSSFLTRKSSARRVRDFVENIIR